MAKIISIQKFKKTTVPLTQLMIKTLHLACKKQSLNIKFGQADLDGSFTTLVKRELIDTKTHIVAGKRVQVWYVTTEGINTLKKLGFKDLC